MATQAAPGRMAPKRQSRWARASLLAKAVMGAWVLCAFSMALAFTFAGILHGLGQDLGPDTEGVFWGLFSAGSYLGVAGVALLAAWLVRRWWRHRAHA